MTPTAAPHILARAHSALAEIGAALLSSEDVAAGLGMGPVPWGRFGAHWDDLSPDPYAEELGTRRLRRYGHLTMRAADGSTRTVRHGEFVQPERSNPLYVDRQRHFQPLTTAFSGDPVLTRLLSFLGAVAEVLDPAPHWDVKVHPFRVSAAGGAGQPTPEGLHRDGVTLVSTLLVGRSNAQGGRSVVVGDDGHPVVSATLRQPGTLLLGDDRRTRHSVSPVRPDDPGLPATRDVLVVTFAPRGS